MKMIDKVMEVLQKQGLLPQREEFGIIFKYQMANFLYLFEENDENYFSMYMPYIFEVDEENIDDETILNLVANNLKEEGAGFGVDTNVVTIILPGKEVSFKKMSKDEVAEQILDEILRQQDL